MDYSFEKDTSVIQKGVKFWHVSLFNFKGIILLSILPGWQVATGVQILSLCKIVLDLWYNIFLSLINIIDL